MAQKGSQFRAEATPALRTVCSNCGKSIPTEVGHPHPLDAEDRGVWKETWGLVGMENGGPKVFPICKHLIVGAGQHGTVTLSDEAADYFKRKGCSVELEPTPTATRSWNTAKGAVIGLFHVTC